MERLLNLSSSANLVRAGALLCAICFMFLFGCNDPAPSCEISVSGPGSVCNIQYTDGDGINHTLVVQADSDIITLSDCDEVLSVNCS